MTGRKAGFIFHAGAEAYGARGVRATDADALEEALTKSLAIEAPTLIEAPVGMMPSPF